MGSRPEGRLLIGGELVESESGRWIDSVNPADETICGRAVAGTAKDVARAVDATRLAWPAWAERGVAGAANCCGFSARS